MQNPSSKLEPFRDFIAAERRKKTPYRRIAELLAAKGVTVDYSTIHSYVKVRAKPPREVISMWEQPKPETIDPPKHPLTVAMLPRNIPTADTAPDHSGQLDAIRRLKAAKLDKRRPEKGLPSFEEGAPLERLSDEEARQLGRKL